MKKSIITLIAILAVNICTSCSTAKNNSIENKIKQYPEVSFNNVNEIINNMISLIVDANSEESFTKGHIPSSVSYAKLKDNLNFILPSNKKTEIVCYCGSEHCIAWLQAADAIKALGYTNVKHFSGGLKGWEEAGGKLIEDKPIE